VSEEDMLAFFTQVLGATLMDPDGSRYLRAGHVDVSPFAIDPSDPEEYEYRVAALGFQRRVLVIFRLSNLAALDERDEAYRQVVKAALEFFAAHPDDGVLLHYGEYLMLECRDGEVTIDSGLDAFMEDPVLTEMVAGYPHRKLRQPFQ
jgi:hypothetical protein